MMCKHELSVPLEVSAAPPRNLWRCTCKLTSMRNLQTPHNWLMTQLHFVTWWRSCALLLRWEHRSPRQGFRNLGTHCGPGQICSCLYIRLGYHKIVWRENYFGTHQFWDENFFSSKKDREYFHQISSFRRMEIETEFSRMKWFTGINSLLQILRPQFVLNMINVSPSLCTTSAVISALSLLLPVPPKRTMAFQGVAGLQAEWKYLPLVQMSQQHW